MLIEQLDNNDGRVPKVWIHFKNNNSASCIVHKKKKMETQANLKLQE